jgi:hypothetical protein
MSNPRSLVCVLLARISRAVAAILAIPMALWAPQSFAAPAPITQAYLACPAGRNTINSLVCTGSEEIIEGAAPNASNFLSSFIGYVNTTAVAGATPTYFACSAAISFGLQQCTKQYSIIKGSAPNPNSYVSWLIGYVYTTQVAGTQPTYIVCPSATSILGPVCGPAPPGASPFTIVRGAAPNPNSYISWFIGYVYPAVPVTTYTGIPKYYIGSVIYVPPGPGSYIQYGTGTNTGTTLSMTQSFSNSSTAGVSEGTPKGSGTINANISVNIGNSFGGSTTNSTDVELTDNVNDKYQAPAANVLNHDYDQILLFFGAKVTENVDYYGKITWAVSFASLDNTDDAASGYPVSVGCLRPISTIPAAQCAGTLAFLKSRGITSADYPSIMNADPFANPNGSQVPASSRFVKLDSFSYYGDPTTVTYTYMVNNTTTVMNSVTTSYSYTDGISGSLYGLTLGSSVVFTNSSTTSNKTASTDTSMLSLTMPTTSYTGPTTLNMYEDTIYKTFMFSYY